MLIQRGARWSSALLAIAVLVLVLADIVTLGVGVPTRTSPRPGRSGIVAGPRPPSSTSVPGAAAPSPTLRSVPSTTVPVGPNLLEPDGVAFWTAQRGLLVATMTTAVCRYRTASCPSSVIERTSDEGRTWTVVDRVAGPVKDVTVAGTGVAWVSTGRCGAASPDACAASLLIETTDGGTTWTNVAPQSSVTSVSPTSATTGWGVVGGFNDVPTHTVLVHTDDGGRTWQTRAEPCRSIANDVILSPWSVRFATTNNGWAMCVSQPATDMLSKALLETTDGGLHWHVQSDTCVGSTAVGRIPCIGYLPGMSFSASGYGLLWLGRGNLSSTTDAGRTWNTVAPQLVMHDVNSVISASVASTDVAEAVVREVDKKVFVLATTTDGNTWTVQQSWPDQ